MLQELSEKNKIWLDFAKKLCNDYDLACDLVQEMYLYFNNKNKVVNNYYVFMKIKHLFFDYCKKQDRINNTSIENFHYLKDTDNSFEPNDKEQIVLDKYDRLNWLEKELIQEYYISEKSLRQIQKEYPHINYGYAYRVISNAKAKLNG